MSLAEEEDIADHKMEATLEKQLETVENLMPNAVPAKYVSVPKAPVVAANKVASLAPAQEETAEVTAEEPAPTAQEVTAPTAQEVTAPTAQETAETNEPSSAPGYDLAKNTGEPNYDVASNKPDYAFAKNTGPEIYTETTPIANESAPISTAPIESAPIANVSAPIESAPIETAISTPLTRSASINFEQPGDTSADPNLVLQPPEYEKREPEIIGEHLASRAARFLKTANPDADVNTIQSGLNKNVQKNLNINREQQQIIEKEKKPTLNLQGGKKRKTYRKKKPKKNKTVKKRRKNKKTKRKL
jgi:hypothetical protein